MGREKDTQRGGLLGIKTAISKDDLPLKYQGISLVQTTDGVSDSVYLLEEKFVLKIFESPSLEIIENEKKLLKMTSTLKVPEIVDSFYIREKPAVIYTQIAGKSVDKPQIDQIRQIGSFLKEFHSLTKTLKSSNPILFSKNRLETLIMDSGNDELLKHFKSINIELKEDGIIHGDLFCDNAKFQNGLLSGVYDFSEACNGDFIFDLGVTAVSWCFEGHSLHKEKLEALRSSYSLDLEYDRFKEYIKYALLYYATTRYINNRDYKELLMKLENL